MSIGRFAALGAMMTLAGCVTGGPPSGSQKSYSIVITVGADRHVIEIAQTPVGA